MGLFEILSILTIFLALEFLLVIAAVKRRKADRDLPIWLFGIMVSFFSAVPILDLLHITGKLNFPSNIPNESYVLYGIILAALYILAVLFFILIDIKKSMQDSYHGDKKVSYLEDYRKKNRN